MRGWLDQWTGATFSTRLGFADLIPLTGMFKAKSNAGEHWREAENFAGPVFSGVSGLMGTAAQLVRYGAEAVGLKDDTTRFRDILRDSPSAAIRGLADGMTYLSDGKITRADGTVLDNEVGVMTSVFRMMGFYPYQVMVQNDIIRMTKQTQAYAQDMKAHYKQAYVKARLEKNRGEMRRIMKFVKEHNKDVGPRSEFYFKDFIGSANKTYNSARENSLNRFRKFAPKQMRPVVDQMKEIYGID
jgi:ribosomal protein S15P/S13E